MPYPTDLLSPEEEIIREFRPHWTALAGQLGVTALAIVALVVIGVTVEGRARTWSLLAVVAVWAVLTTRGFLDWWFTQHVITNERVIFRAGILAKRGKEIPLEMINSVSFSQTWFERIVRSGDLLIESAAETGQTRYTDIPHPERIQTLIYMNREARMFQIEGSGSGGGTSVAEQLQILARLQDEGKLTPEEFETEKRRLLGQASDEGGST